MAVHEAAEGEVLHPARRESLGDAIADERQEEENAPRRRARGARQVLDTRSPQFETNVRTLQAAFLAHARAEEQTELDELSSEPDATRLERMRRAVALTEAVAPSSPRPGLAYATENIALGPYACMIDRARNVLG